MSHLAIRKSVLFSALVFLQASSSCSEQRGRAEADHEVLQRHVEIGEPVANTGKDIDYIFQDRDGTYWIASNGEGVYTYDGTTLRHISSKDGLCSNYVWSVQQDVNGWLWFSTRDGICAFDGTRFTDYTEKIHSAPVGALLFSTGSIFFGHQDAVCCYDGTSFTNFVIHPATYHPAPNNGVRPYAVYSSLVDKRGRIWFGTQSEGVARYDNGAITYLTEKDLAGPAVRTLFEDHNGNLWFGNNGGGLFRYDGNTLTNLTMERGLGNPEFLHDAKSAKLGSLARVWSITEDSLGNLWIATIDAGVWKYDGKQLTNYTMEDGLPGNSIWGIYKNKQGELLFIVEGSAICRFDGKRFSPFAFGK